MLFLSGSWGHQTKGAELQHLLQTACPCPLKIHVQILTSNVMLLEVGAFGKGIGLEGRTLMNEISILIKETSKSSLAPSTTRKHSKKRTVYEPGSRPTPNPKSADALILDLSASITVRNKFLLLLNHPGYILILCLQQTELKQYPSQRTNEASRTISRKRLGQDMTMILQASSRLSNLR